jgi:thymidylate synthase
MASSDGEWVSASAPTAIVEAECAPPTKKRTLPTFVQAAAVRHGKPPPPPEVPVYSKEELRRRLDSQAQMYKNTHAKQQQSVLEQATKDLQERVRTLEAENRELQASHTVATDRLGEEHASRLRALTIELEAKAAADVLRAEEEGRAATAGVEAVWRKRVSECEAAWRKHVKDVRAFMEADYKRRTRAVEEAFDLQLGKVITALNESLRQQNTRSLEALLSTGELRSSVAEGLMTFNASVDEIREGYSAKAVELKKGYDKDRAELKKGYERDRAELEGKLIPRVREETARHARAVAALKQEQEQHAKDTKRWDAEKTSMLSTWAAEKARLEATARSLQQRYDALFEQNARNIRNHSDQIANLIRPRPPPGGHPPRY